ncbi:hypothetical protein BD309DRAFT_873169 [Dichomitus squalens]|uniref:Uncharacterized protein n=1 Tax=Dichomitus squalens TaxID=114155 RepID=A0A4Q9PVF6_9APHY|nr:hypothetical protein BD309DRAFT_873169 [Dichomitus squalens]TBU58429.1 hypothetical protein BD310DRAFT_927291 [Dichomitus squalens]
MSSTPPPYETVHKYEKRPLDSPKDEASPRPPARISRLKIAFVLVLVYLDVLVLAQHFNIFSFLLDDVPLEKQNTLRHEWRREQDAHAREVAVWNHERATHVREMHAWQHELVALQDRREQWMREAEAERAQWAAERRSEELRKKEVERMRQGVHWSEAWGNQRCSAYGARAYNARLLDIPEELGWYEVCADMPNRFHGRWVDRPARCQRDRNGVWATWYIDFEEPRCITYWDTLRDLGCSSAQSGKRRYEARLMNLTHRDDWDAMCSTTPATINGIHFDHPTACEDRAGATGVWDVPDDTCF